jgi:hypothetical protein
MKALRMLSAWILVLAVCQFASAQSDRSPNAIFRSAQPSIVLIIGGDQNGKATVQGSGFIIGPNRLMLGATTMCVLAIKDAANIFAGHCAQFWPPLFRFASVVGPGLDVASAEKALEELSGSGLPRLRPRGRWNSMSRLSHTPSST